MTVSRRQWDALIGAVLVAGALLIAATRDTGQPAVAPAAAPAVAGAEPAPLPGHPAPPFELPTADGGRVALGDLRGQVVLVNIWATWCPPCRAEMPAIQAVYERYRAQGFTVLAVNLEEDAQTVSAFLAERGLTFPAPLDADGSVAQAYAAHAIPSSFFVDRRGTVRVVYRGPLPLGVIDTTVEQLLAEPPGE